MKAETASRYPLTWPHGWKRCPEHLRRRAKFNRREQVQGSAPGTSWSRNRQMTVAEAVGRIRGELARMGVREGNVIVSTNVETRLDGMPYSNRAEPRDPGAAVYWRINGADKVMAIDRYDRVADNLAAIAATLDAMRAIERHGGAAILDRAFTGFTALPSPAMATAPSWRDVLWPGASPVQASLKDAEDAYRRRRSETHPDREGGSQDAFDLVQRAWEQAQQELRA